MEKVLLRYKGSEYTHYVNETMLSLLLLLSLASFLKSKMILSQKRENKKGKELSFEYPLKESLSVFNLYCFPIRRGNILLTNGILNYDEQ